jgi:hypothetical protein
MGMAAAHRTRGRPSHERVPTDPRAGAKLLARVSKLISFICNLFRSFELSSTSVHNDVTLASESAVPAGTSSCAYALEAHH